ncbi:PAS domain S-box protein [Hymenobacter persicinus]|uniref:histidine kinase n=1 Tax=Hymenobacter persicinus TaxID=2025506 RepID=A0A4Q5L8R7_9BACT|nr:PAS domain S-box protein [Hymenobacter persicinus]RYU78088.1 PAS domain S-box protein [Hymenobacter persicinus]
MTTIGYRHLQRQLRQARRAQAAAQLELQTLQEQIARQRAAAADQASALLQTMPTALLAANQLGQVTLINQRLCTLLGLPGAPATYLGQSWAAVLTQGTIRFRDEPAARARTEALVAAGQRVRGELYELDNGTVLQQEYLPVGQEGQTVLHLWSYEDVTQQQQQQGHIHELSRLTELNPNPVMRCDRHVQVFYANPAGRRLLNLLAQTHERESREFLGHEIRLALEERQTRRSERHLDGSFYLWTVVPSVPDDQCTIYLTDITARRRVEVELRRQQLFTQRINDTVPTLVFVFDLETLSISHCNNQCQALLGYSEAEVIAAGAQILPRIMTAADWQLWQSQIPRLKAMPDGQTHISEYKARHRDGSWRWLHIKSTPFTRRANGMVQQLVVVGEDVTNRRVIEEELRQSRLFVERVANTVPNLIYIYDIQQHRNVYCNRYIETVLGYSAAELQAMGQSMLTLLMPEHESSRLREHFVQVGQLADGQTADIEYHLYHRNGSVRWLRVSHTPFERDAAGQVRLVVGAAEDITNWKLAEEQRRSANRRLSEQNRLFRQVIDATPHLIYLKDRNGRYLLANQATAELYGLSVEQVLQTPPEQLPASAADMSSYIEADQRVIDTRQEIAAEKTYTRPNGEVVWFYSVKRPFVLADGTVQVLGIDSNITELKGTQLALRGAKDAAEENARVKQDFLANMSHEIRTPMNGILGLAGLLSKTPLDEQQGQYLSHIRHSAEQLLVVINDILAMTQISAGKLRLENTPFELREVLRACHQLLLPRAAEKGIGLELELPLPSQATTVLGDPYRLRQVLLNLLSNAVKFTEHGTVRLSCQRLTESDEKPIFHFTVSDTGIGIPAHQLGRIFESFTQASASTAREYGGSGLGLSISHELVQLLGGEIVVESQPGVGTSFQFDLPFGPAETTEIPVVARETAPNYRSLGARRALLAEDNAVNQFLVKTLLNSWGFHVDTATTGPEALNCFRQNPYDVVLMDIQMPGMDGVEATQQLRQHPDAQRAATPVLALTAHAMRGEAQRYLAAGFNAYLSKPFREEELFRVISDLLHGRPFVAPVPATPPTAAPPAAPTAPLYDLSGLRRLAHGNEAFVGRLVQLFIQTTPPIVRELEQHLAAQAWPKLASVAHHLKSSLDGMHIRALHGIIRELEACSATSDPVLLTRQVAQVRQITEQVIAELQREFET